MDEVTQVLFGMDGFRVLGAVEDALDGELTVVVETVDPVRGCPECGVVGQVKERPVISLRDATSAGRRVRVRWQKRRWVCLEAACDRGSWTEQNDAVGARRRTTRRCRKQIAIPVTRGRAVAEAADEVGLGWRAAMRAVAEEANVPDRSRPVVRLGVDENGASPPRSWPVRSWPSSSPRVASSGSSGSVVRTVRRIERREATSRSAGTT